MTIAFDKADTRFLEHLSYDPSETALIVTVVEGKRSPVPRDVVIGEQERFVKTGLPSVLSHSPYLDYVASTHGWYNDVAGPAEHFRVWSENEVIDVIAIEPPTITVEPGSEPAPGEAAN